MQGLQIFDENGNAILDLSDRITTFLTKLHVPKGGRTVTYHNDLLLSNEFFYVFSPLILSASTRVSVTQTGNQISFNIKGNSDLDILVGVF